MKKVEEKQSICNFEKPVEILEMTIYEEFTDLGTNIAEIGIDQILEIDILKEIPIISSLIGLGKIVITAKELLLTKKILVFNQQLKNGTASREIIEKHKIKIMKKPSLAKKELEVVLAHLDKHIKYTKNMMLANFYLMHIDDRIEFDWNDFEEMADIVNDISVFDLNTLGELYTKIKYTEDDEYNYLSTKRLNACGLVDYYGGMSMTRASQEGSFLAIINDMGKFFWENGMKGIKTYLIIDGEGIIL